MFCVGHLECVNFAIFVQGAAWSISGVKHMISVVLFAQISEFRSVAHLLLISCSFFAVKMTINLVLNVNKMSSK